MIRKKDADEDFVYDTIGAIDLSTGKYQDLLEVGNSDYWTYFADGSGIAIYDNEFQPDTILYYATATHKLLTYPAKRRVESLDTFFLLPVVIHRSMTLPLLSFGLMIE